MEFKEFRKRKDVKGMKERGGMGSIWGGCYNSDSFSLELCNLRNIGIGRNSKDIRTIGQVAMEEGIIQGEKSAGG
jgi:hypothetical protein